MHTQASAEQSTPQGHPSLGARHLSRDQGGFRATEPRKTLKADRNRRHLSGGKQMFSGTFLQMPPPPGSLPCPHHPRAPSFPARGDREERRRSGIRKRVQTEAGLRSCWLQILPGNFCTSPMHWADPSLFLTSRDGQDCSPLYPAPAPASPWASTKEPRLVRVPVAC